MRTGIGASPLKERAYSYLLEPQFSHLEPGKAFCLFTFSQGHGM